MPGMEFPALADPGVLPVVAMLYQLERNQWADPAEHRAQSFRQLHHMLSIAQAKVHYYHVLLNELAFDPMVPLTEEFWATIPVMTRQTLQDEKKRLLSTDIPKEHQPFTQVNSSGSTGKPVEVFQPAFKRYTFAATNILENIIHEADLSKKSASIRIVKNEGFGPDGKEMPDWGQPISGIFHTGPSILLDAGQDPSVQADWLIKHDPGYLQIYPSNLAAMLPILAERNVQLSNLHYIRTFGEQLPPDLREDVRAQLGIKIVDSYSSQEVGFIAIQCPEHEHYHLIQDACFTEILNDDNQPCGPGEVGRVVVTDLLNTSFPLVRYDIGDYAEAGALCDCGRGWPVVNRVMGRVRNLVTYPDGTRKWPLTAARKFRDVAPIRQYQIVQNTLETMQIKLIADRHLSDDERSQIQALIHGRFGDAFDIEVQQVDSIPRGANGKFEEFKSNITPEMIAAIGAAS